MTVLTDNPQSPFYEQLLCAVDKQLLHLQDARGKFLLDKVHERNMKYYIHNVVDKPWNNHLLLVIYVYSDNNADVGTIYNVIGNIHSRLKDIFDVFQLENMTEFDVETHMYQYLKGSYYQEHSDSKRKELLKWYRAVSYNKKKWITTKLNSSKQSYFDQYLFPMPSYDSRDFPFTKSATEQAHNTRKNETDVIVPLLPQIRAEGHFRWNQLNRLRQAFLKACEQAKKTNCPLPLEFHYDEPERIGERFYFRLWDKPAFALLHPDQFPSSSLKSAYKRIGAYSEDNNQYFVEFIKAECLEEDDEAEGLWFMELFEKGVIGQWFANATDEEIKQKRALLYSWGYGEEGKGRNPQPFSSRHKGVLATSTFISRYQHIAEGTLLDVEPLYAAVTFGLLAVDIFTTTGARLNELLQISNTRECIRKVKVENKLNYSFYAIPKGRDEVEPFYISEQTMKLIQLVAKLLKDHYGSEKIPSVKYRYSRSHLFPVPKPYFFQYHNNSFTEFTVWACLRFLLHGLNFESKEGKPVVIKTHLLRHAFATEAVQRQGLPIDIVAKILHQRDIGVTEYYAEPTPSQVAQSVSDLHDVISDYVDLDETVLRSPEELEKELEEYKQQVGVFNNVLGGTCVTAFVCPTKMQCLGCQAKVPQPEKKQELEEVIELSKDMEKRFTKMNLPVEVKKAKTMRKYARNELKEIELIEKYREEQKYEPHIQFDRR
ncbi:site-specific integrase [Cytobacillus dafuensis]|uniref:Site-specific integrase n=1 Tax=Cytobacillus dafuensis TaxID=1742359 RepID=A0A5B8ZCM2_CYTDA|nr:site-specific integrase [Cytobacillus dafuensis]QED50013.1 site-specific integrase [Cytobacillus dafuensis]